MYSCKCASVCTDIQVTAPNVVAVLQEAATKAAPFVAESALRIMLALGIPRAECEAALKEAARPKQVWAYCTTWLVACRTVSRRVAGASLT